MTSTNDEKDVKSNQTSGPKGKTYYIELYKSLESALSSAAPLSERTEALCAAWGRVHKLCAHSAATTHAHLLAWVQRHTARIILQTEWQSPASAEYRYCLDSALSSFLRETEEATAARNGLAHDWETALAQRAEWFRKTVPEPWGHPVLRKLLDHSGPQPSHDEVIEWLKEERGVIFVTRLRQLASSKCNDLALALTTAIMERVRATAILDEEPEGSETKEHSYRETLTAHAGFTCDVWELLIDLEFVLLHKMGRTSRCIELAKQTPLRTGYQLVERLRTRLETSPREKKLWKNGRDVATIIAQVIVTRCMVTPVCADASRAALYCCTRSLVRLLPAARLPAAAAALAAPAATPRHLHTLAAATEAQCTEEMKPFVCELYVRAITAGMNDLERLKVVKEKESEARTMEQTVASWFVQLGKLLSASPRIKCECALTAFSMHPSPTMFERLKDAPPLPAVVGWWIKCECALTAFSMHPSPAMFERLKDAPPLPAVVDKTEVDEEVKSEFGSWATDSHGQSNFVKTSETLKLKNAPKQTNILSTALLTEGETLGLSAELCQDIAALLSGPRLKTLSWDMDRDKLLEICRGHMERTNCGTRTLTTELRFLNIDPSEWQHLPEEDDGEGDVYYGIERGYEHLVELPEPEPEEIWADAILTDSDRTISAGSSSAEQDDYMVEVQRKKRSRSKKEKTDFVSDEVDPLSLPSDTKERPPSKERQTEKKDKPRKDRPKGDESSKSKSKKKRETSQERRKEIKAQKKRDKKERKKLEHDDVPTRPITSLSSLIGLRVCASEDIQPDLKIEKNMQKEKKKKPPIDGLRLSSESDSHSVQYDGQFSMDDLKTVSPKGDIIGNESATPRPTSAIDNRSNPSPSPSIPSPLPQSPGYTTKPPMCDDVRNRMMQLLAFRRQKAPNSSPLSSPNQSFTQDPPTAYKEELSSSSGGLSSDAPLVSKPHPQLQVTPVPKPVTSTPIISDSIPNNNITAHGGHITLNNIAGAYPATYSPRVHGYLNPRANNVCNNIPATVTSQSQINVTPAVQPLGATQATPKPPKTKPPKQKKPPVNKQTNPNSSVLTDSANQVPNNVANAQANQLNRKVLPAVIDKLWLNKPSESKPAANEPPRKIHGMKDFISSLLQSDYKKNGQDASVTEAVLKRLTEDEDTSAKAMQRKQLEDAPKTFSRRAYYKNSKQKQTTKQTAEQEAISNELERHIRQFQQLKQLTVGKVDQPKTPASIEPQNTSPNKYSQANPVLTSFLNAPSPVKKDQTEALRSNVPLSSTHMDQKEILSLLQQQNNLIGKNYTSIGATPNIVHTSQYQNKPNVTVNKVPNFTITGQANINKPYVTMNKVPNSTITGQANINKPNVTVNKVPNSTITGQANINKPNVTVNKVPNSTITGQAYTNKPNVTVNKVPNSTITGQANINKPNVTVNKVLNFTITGQANINKPNVTVNKVPNSTITGPFNTGNDTEGFQSEFNKMVGQSVLLSNNKAYLEYDNEPVVAPFLYQGAFTNAKAKKDNLAPKPKGKSKRAPKKNQAQITNDLVSVMDALRNHKTPSRGPNALDLVLNKNEKTKKVITIKKTPQTNTTIDKEVNEQLNHDLKQTAAVPKPTKVPEVKAAKPLDYTINRLIENEVAYQMTANNYKIQDPTKLMEVVKNMFKPDAQKLTPNTQQHGKSGNQLLQIGSSTVKKVRAKRKPKPKLQIKPVAVQKTHLTIPSVKAPSAQVEIEKELLTKPTLIQKGPTQKVAAYIPGKTFEVQIGPNSVPKLVEIPKGPISISNTIKIQESVIIKPASIKKESKAPPPQKRVQEKLPLPAIQEEYPLLDELMDKDLLDEIDELLSEEDLPKIEVTGNIESTGNVVGNEIQPPMQSTSTNSTIIDAKKCQNLLGLRVVHKTGFEPTAKPMPMVKYTIPSATVPQKPNLTLASVPVSNIVLLRPNVIAYPPQNQVFTQGPLGSYIVNTAPNLAVYQTTQYAAPVINQIIIGNATSVHEYNNPNNFSTDESSVGQNTAEKTDELPQYAEANTLDNTSATKAPTNSEAKPKKKIEILENVTLKFDCTTRGKERKVLHEVQEKQNAPPTETTIKPEKNSVARVKQETVVEKKEKVIRKDSERIKIKRHAILNREIHKRCNLQPIPLFYKPLITTIPIAKPNIVLETVLKDSPSGISKSEEVKGAIKEVAKENSVTDSAYRRILLRSSNKVAKTPKSPPKVAKRTIEKKPRAAPKKKAQAASKTDGVVDMTPTRVSKRNLNKRSLLKKQEDKTVVPETNTQVIDMHKLIDIEDELLPTFIPTEKKITPESKGQVKPIISPVERKINSYHEGQKPEITPENNAPKEAVSEQSKSTHTVKNSDTLFMKEFLSAINESRQQFSPTIKKDMTNESGKSDPILVETPKVDDKANISEPQKMSPVEEKPSSATEGNEGTNKPPLDVTKKLKRNIPGPLRSKQVEEKPSSVTEENKEETDNPSIDYMKDIKLNSVKIIPARPGQPSKKCIQLTLPNDKVYKVTVSGATNIDMHTLFANPDIKKIITSCWSDSSKYRLNIRHDPHQNEPLKVVESQEVKHKKVAEAKIMDTIDLISDEELDQNKFSSLKTEFGVYEITTESIDVEKLQMDMNRKCTVKLVKHPDSFFVRASSVDTSEIVSETEIECTTETPVDEESGQNTSIELPTAPVTVEMTPQVTVEVDKVTIKINRPLIEITETMQSEPHSIPELDMTVDCEETIVRKSSTVDKVIEPRKERRQKVDDVVVTGSLSDSVYKEQFEDGIIKKAKVDIKSTDIVSDDAVTGEIIDVVASGPVKDDEIKPSEDSIKNIEEASNVVTASEQIEGDVIEPSDGKVTNEVIVPDEVVLINEEKPDESKLNEGHAKEAVIKPTEDIVATSDESVTVNEEKVDDSKPKPSEEKETSGDTLYIAQDKVDVGRATLTIEDTVDKIYSSDNIAFVNEKQCDQAKPTKNTVKENDASDDIVLVDEKQVDIIQDERTEAKVEEKNVAVDILIVNEGLVYIDQAELTKDTIKEDDASDDILFVNEEQIDTHTAHQTVGTVKDDSDSDDIVFIDDEVTLLSNESTLPVDVSIINDDIVKKLVDEILLDGTLKAMSNESSIVNPSSSILPEVIELDSSSSDEHDNSDLEMSVNLPTKSAQPEEKINELKNLLLNDLGVLNDDAPNSIGPLNSAVARKRPRNRRNASKQVDATPKDPKLCQESFVQLVNCDELVEKHKVQNAIIRRKCLIKLVKCDHMIKNYHDSDSEIDFDVASPNAELNRSGSPSILNHIPWEEDLDLALADDSESEMTGTTSPVMEIFDIMSRLNKADKGESRDLVLVGFSNPEGRTSPVMKIYDIMARVRKNAEKSLDVKCNAEWFLTKTPKHYSKKPLVMTLKQTSLKSMVTSLFSMALSNLNQMPELPGTPSRKRKQNFTEETVVTKKTTKNVEIEGSIAEPNLAIPIEYSAIRNVNLKPNDIQVESSECVEIENHTLIEDVVETSSQEEIATQYDEETSKSVKLEVCTNIIMKVSEPISVDNATEETSCLDTIGDVTTETETKNYMSIDELNQKDDGAISIENTIEEISSPYPTENNNNVTLPMATEITEECEVPMACDIEKEPKTSNLNTDAPLVTSDVNMSSCDVETSVEQYSERENANMVVSLTPDDFIEEALITPTDEPVTSDAFEISLEQAKELENGEAIHGPKTPENIIDMPITTTSTDVSEPLVDQSIELQKSEAIQETNTPDEAIEVTAASDEPMSSVVSETLLDKSMEPATEESIERSKTPEQSSQPENLQEVTEEAKSSNEISENKWQSPSESMQIIEEYIKPNQNKDNDSVAFQNINSKRSVECNEINTDKVQAMSDCTEEVTIPAFEETPDTTVSTNDISEKPTRDLVTPAMDRTIKATVSTNDISERPTQDLVTIPAIEESTEITVSTNDISDIPTQPLVTIPALEETTEITVSSNDISEKSSQALLTVPPMEGPTEMTVSTNDISAKPTEALVTIPSLEETTETTVSTNDISDEATQALDIEKVNSDHVSDVIWCDVTEGDGEVVLDFVNDKEKSVVESPKPESAQESAESPIIKSVQQETSFHKMMVSVSVDVESTDEFCSFSDEEIAVKPSQEIATPEPKSSVEMVQSPDVTKSPGKETVGTEIREETIDGIGCDTSKENVEREESPKSAREENSDTIETVSPGEIDIQYDVNSPLIEAGIRESSTPIDYAEQTGIILKGIEFKDPIVGTCYVFRPIDDSVSDTASVKTESDSLNESAEVYEIVKIMEDDEMASPEEYVNSESPIVTPPTRNPGTPQNEDNLELELRVTTPKFTYRNLKRKLSPPEVKCNKKRYRKGKQIDCPKLSATAIKDSAFGSEYKNLIDYIDTVEFSYSRPFHKDCLDVGEACSNWPLAGPMVKFEKDSSETMDTALFSDVCNETQEETNNDPLNKPLVEELSADLGADISTSTEPETNFNMGFGEQSGRVIQNLKEGVDISKFSAATLSDVKHIQPFLLPTGENGESEVDPRECTGDQKDKLIRSINYIHLKHKVRSFFAKIKLDLVDNTAPKWKEDTDERKVFQNVPGLYCTEFLVPEPTPPTVNVVQVGQLPVSAAAQNPVTIDPRVTQVSDASPSQCSVENSPRSDTNQASIKAEYTELTNADLSLPLVQDLSEQNQSATVKDREPITTEQTVIPTEVEIKSEVKDERLDLSSDNSASEPKHQEPIDFNYENSNTNETATNMSNDLLPDLFNTPTQQDDETFQSSVKQENGSVEKTDQIAHAMNAAGITTTPEETVTKEYIRPHPLANLISQKVIRTSPPTTGQPANSYQKTSINAMALQQALAQILPPPLNQTTGENGQQTTNTTHGPQVLHIVQGNNASGNQITLVDNSQQSVISTPNATQVLHIVQNKSAAGTTSNGNPNTQNFSGLSLVDAGLQQGGNQLLHIVNTGNQKNSNATGQLLKRVNLLTNLTNVQGGNEQKMVQFVCKSADGKSIHLNAPHQRSMVLRLQPIETPNVQANVSKPVENQELSPTSNQSKDVANQEIKSRSIYEENYAKFIQNSTPKTQVPLEKSTSLPKFNQAFGKATFQDGNANKNELNNATHLQQDNAECPPVENTINLDHLTQISSPPLLVRKTAPATSQAQQNLVQQIKQSIAPMNMTMHGGVIYTRQIPVNIGGGQTINLITVPTTELIDENGQKQQGEIETPIIKIVPQTQSNSEGNTEDNPHLGSSGESPQTPQPQQVLTQMRIKLPMLSKSPQVVQGARAVRPAFFQIQRNMIGGANQGQVYQQLVLTAAPPLGQQTIRLPQAPVRQVKVQPETPSPSESQLSSSTLEQLREFDMVLEQVKERSTVQPSGSSNSNSFQKIHTPSTDTTDSNSSVSASSTTTDHTQQVLYSIGNSSTMNVAYVNRKATVTTPTTSTYVRSPDSSGIVDSPSSTSIPQTVTETAPVATSSTSEPSSSTSQPKAAKVGSKSIKSRPKPATVTPSALAKVNNPIPPKTSTQKPLEDEQTTQRILYILAEYKEQVENSPDKDKPAPRRRSNPPSNPGSSKRKKSSSGSRRHGCTRDHSPIDDNCRTMGSEDSSCGTSQGDCTENCSIDAHSPQDSPRKVVRKLTFEQETPLLTQQQPRIQPPRNVIVADGQTITVARSATGKPTTAVLMPANYILPVSMMKGGQQIAIVTNRGPKLLTVGGAPGEAGAANALLLQRLIGPAGLKPVLARPGVRHVRLPATALHNLQAFNIQAVPTPQPPDSTASPAPAPTPPELVETRANSSPWEREPSTSEGKPDRGSSPEASEPWHLQSSSDTPDYTYEEPTRADNDRTVLVVQKKDGSTHGLHRVTHISSAALRHKYAILEHELRLQKSLSEECEDLGVDSPSASELFPEAELLFAASPAHDHSHHAPQQSLLSQSSIPQPDMDDQIATDHLLPVARDQLTDRLTDQPELTDDGDLGLGSVGIVTVSEDGSATIALDQEEFARAHPNTTFHSEPTDVGVEVPPFSIASGLAKGRHITSTIFHSNSATATVLMTAPQQTVISQATQDTSHGQTNTVKYADIDNMINSLPANDLNLSSVLVKDDGLTRFDSILTDSRELHLSNTAAAIVHPNVTQVIRRVCYDEDTKRDRERFLMDENDGLIAGDDAKMSVPEESSRDATMDSIPDDNDEDSSPERHAELFWESNSASERSESRRPLDFSSDSDKCCKSPSLDETNSTDSSGVGTHLRLDSVIKEARARERSGSVDNSSADDTIHPPIRTYPPKRSFHNEGEVERSLSGKTRAGERSSPDSPEVRRRASNRGVVKRGCHCCNGSPAPPRPKKPRQRKPTLDFANSN